MICFCFLLNTIAYANSGYNGIVSLRNGNQKIVGARITFQREDGQGINPHDPDQQAKAKKFRTRSSGGHITKLDCYVIDRVEFPAAHSSYKYVVKDPYVCVDPTASRPSFLGISLAIIGSNYFEKTAIVFDGPRMRLGFFSGVRDR